MGDRLLELGIGSVGVMRQPYREPKGGGITLNRERLARFEKELAELAEVTPGEDAVYELSNDYAMGQVNLVFHGVDVHVELGLDQVLAVTRNSYRTAVVNGVLLSVDRNEANPLEEWLIEKVGLRGDNHVVYALSTQNGPWLYLMCSDQKIHIGTERIKGSW